MFIMYLASHIPDGTWPNDSADNSTKKSKQKTGKIFLEVFLHNAQSNPMGKGWTEKQWVEFWQTKMSPKTQHFAPLHFTPLAL